MAPMAPPLDTPLPLGLVALAGTMEKRDGGGWWWRCRPCGGWLLLVLGDSHLGGLGCDVAVDVVAVQRLPNFAPGLMKTTLHALCCSPTHRICPMVDFFLLRWFMRCKLLVVLDVLIYVYVTCSCMLCSDQTSMLGRAGEGVGCVL
jgi:hypothetical protein